MQINITLDGYDVHSQLEGALRKAINEYIVPKMEEYMKEAISDEKVGEYILQRMKVNLDYASYDPHRNGDMLCNLIQDRIAEIASRITDEDIKKVILQRFACKL